MEREVLQQIQQSKWLESRKDKKIQLKNGTTWIPDFVVFNDGKPYIAVEIKASFLLVTKTWIEVKAAVINGHAIPFLILTDGTIFDVYNTKTGRHSRYMKFPTKEELSSEGGNET